MTIPTFPHPSLYVGDFNCQHVNWGYNTTSPNSESLDSCATSNNLGLLYNPKETASLSSRRCNVSTNPHLAFASLCQDRGLPDRCVPGKFPQSQHQPSFITPPRLKVPAHSDLVKHWNFRKADWKCFCLLTGESNKRLPPLDTPDTRISARAYLLQLNNVSHMAAGKTMRHAGTKSVRPLSLLYPSPVGTASDKVASSLLS